jgi:glycosyltransferase involved in cell wall biosynthesis
MPSGALTVSVAMATYNGAAFLESQLASIAEQSRLPIELVVSDDGSDDDTVRIAERFAPQAPFAVHVSRNTARLGFAGNFLQAARLCRGDLIAWSDQDDVWMGEKLARCVEEFESDSEVRLVVHSRQIGMQTRRGHPLARGGPNDRLSSVARRRAVFTPGSLPLWFSAPGMASVIDRRVVEIGDSLAVELPGNFEEYGHDTWTAFLAAAVGKTVFLPDVLARYRIHGGNVFGVAEHSSSAARVRASATRGRSTFQKELERIAAKASFRTEILLQVARQNGGRGPLTRAARWSRQEQVHRRRIELYEKSLSRTQGARRLLVDVARADYGRRSRGGLGPTSLLRDIYQVASSRR